MNRIFIIGSPEHGNLGDHGIVIAMHKFLHDYFADYDVHEITGKSFYLMPEKAQHMISKNDLIIVPGGGFMGSLWMTSENMLRNILASFPANPVVIFPQSVFFEDNRHGETEYNASKAAYENHPDLTIMLREKKSYELMKKLFPAIKKIHLMPDIASYLDLTAPLAERQYISLCLRDDKESIVSPEQKQVLTDLCRSQGYNFKEITTHLGRTEIIPDTRENLFYAMIDDFKTSRLVITDRLHGMLFAAVTSTPCIAMDNLSKKVSGVYEWIKYLSYIKFAGNTPHCGRLIEEQNKHSLHGVYDNSNLSIYFDQMAAILRDKLEN